MICLDKDEVLFHRIGMFSVIKGTHLVPTLTSAFRHVQTTKSDEIGLKFSR